MNKKYNEELTKNIIPQKSKKSSTISFRVDEDYLKELRKEAQEKKVSLNTLANQIFGEYIEWQRYTERFGIVSMSKDAFKYILDSLDDNQVIELATTIGQKAPKEFIIFKWKNLDSENIINFIKMYLGHCGYGRYDYAKDIENSNYTFSIHHDFGRKGSLFLKSFLEILIKSTLQKDCQSIVTENSLAIFFNE
ncbi:MAG: uncharacterized protein K0S93_925 [Nitrososphaeraceae archaeon]|jgi:hypothetical protein|nr:uncharacterized protein [Nitrososphaeraceae archaeon]